MTELHERLTGGLFGERVEFHRGENKQSRRTEEQKGEADKINQIRIELFNMPVLAVEMPESKQVEKPDLKNLNTGSGFLEIIEMFLEVIIETAKAIFSKRKGRPVNS
jgi:hypothetical protein